MKSILYYRLYPTKIMYTAISFWIKKREVFDIFQDMVYKITIRKT